MPLCLGLGLSLVHGYGAAFLPLSLAPFIWLDPQPPYIFQDGLLTPAVNDGDPVALMLDRSGNGRNVTQDTAGSRPLYRTSGGLHWLEFDGVDDTLEAAAITLDQPFDEISAWRILTAAGPDNFIGSPALFYIRAGATVFGMFAGLAESDVGALSAEDADFVATARFDAAASRLAIDNGSYTTVSANIGTTGRTAMMLGGGGGVGNVHARYYGSFLRPQATTGSLLTDPEIAQLRTYLAGKQGRVL